MFLFLSSGPSHCLPIACPFLTVLPRSYNRFTIASQLFHSDELSLFHHVLPHCFSIASPIDFRFCSSPLICHRFSIDYQLIPRPSYRFAIDSPPLRRHSGKTWGESIEESSWGSWARKVIRSFVRGCSKASFHEWRKTLGGSKGEGREGA